MVRQGHWGIGVMGPCSRNWQCMTSVLHVWLINGNRNEWMLPEYFAGVHKPVRMSSPSVTRFASVSLYINIWIAKAYYGGLLVKTNIKQINKQKTWTTEITRGDSSVSGFGDPFQSPFKAPSFCPGHMAVMWLSWGWLAVSMTVGWTIKSKTEWFCVRALWGAGNIEW